MPGKTADLRAALDAQARTIIDLFSGAGYGFIDPDILQPADIFLDRSGEDIRSRTYVFTDPSGAELALRPDLTVPACRYYLEHEPAGRGEVRYCYSGPAFRFQPDGHDELRPREFDQVGLELFGAGGRGNRGSRNNRAHHRGGPRRGPLGLQGQARRSRPLQQAA